MRTLHHVRLSAESLFYRPGSLNSRVGFSVIEVPKLRGLEWPIIVAGRVRLQGGITAFLRRLVGRRERLI